MLSARTESHPVDHDAVADFINDAAHHDAGPKNMNRVAGRLAAAGWPLGGADTESR